MSAYDELSESVRADLAAIRSREEKERFLLHEGYSPEAITRILGHDPAAFQMDEHTASAASDPPLDKRNDKVINWPLILTLAAMVVLAVFAVPLSRLGTYLFDCILRFFNR